MPGIADLIGSDNLILPDPEEIVIDSSTGEVRQAGADTPASWINALKLLSEESLWFFNKYILGMERLNTSLHLPVCDWLTQVPPYRKLLLMPRDHLKSSLVSKGMPIHMLIQSKESNPYIPNFEGCNTRILIANETATNAQHFLQYIQAKFDSCELLRAFWPHRCWTQSSRESRIWSKEALLLPRTLDYAEASIETIGVGGAITSRHYNVLVLDDLISLEAANSPIVMDATKTWKRASRALYDHPEHSLEYNVGTRWAVADIYEDLEKDPTVEVLRKAIIENGEPIFPEFFSKQHIQHLAKEYGSLFPLLYMNTAIDPRLCDFDPSLLRNFTLDNLTLSYLPDSRDQDLVTLYGEKLASVKNRKITELTSSDLQSRRFRVS